MNYQNTIETAAKAPQRTARARSTKEGLNIFFYKDERITHYLRPSKNKSVYDYELCTADGVMIESVSSHWPLSEIINACKGLG